MDTTYPSDLTDAQWAWIEPWIPAPKLGGRRRTVNMRHVVNGILYLLRAGCSWRMLPKSFGPWSTVYHYYRTFVHNGVWQRIHDSLREHVRIRAGREPTPSAAAIDSQTVKTTEKKGSADTTRAKRS